MKSSRRAFAVLATLVVMTLWSAGGQVSQVHAQASVDRLRPDVVTATEVTDEHRQQIDIYIRHWGDQIQSGTAEQVAEARGRLIEPLRSSPSQPFERYYNPRVGEQLTAAMGSEEVVVRLNAMIVVARLGGTVAVPLIERGMNDESPAVRYWAIKAIQTVDIADRERQAMMERLIRHIEREIEVPVTEQAMLALVDLGTPEAMSRTLDLLNQRVEQHANESGRSLQAEHAGLQRVYQQLARAGGQDQQTVRQQALRQLARAALRYQDLASRQLAAGQVDDSVRKSYVDMVLLTDAVLQFTSNNLNASGAPGSIRVEANRGNWETVHRNTEQWRVLMRRPPFDFSDEDMSVGR